MTLLGFIASYETFDGDSEKAQGQMVRAAATKAGQSLYFYTFLLVCSLLSFVRLALAIVKSL